MFEYIDFIEKKMVKNTEFLCLHSMTVTMKRDETLESFARSQLTGAV